MKEKQVLLTHGYFLHEDEREKEIMRPYPPLGLLYISSFLEKSGLANYVFDSTFSSFTELCDWIEEHKPKYIGIYCNLMTKIRVLDLVEFVKSRPELRSIQLIAGGPDVRYNVEHYLDYGFDVCVIGEGEETLAELIHTMNIPMNPFLDHVHGIAYRNALGETVITPERTKMKALSELPWPNRKAVDLEKYVRAWKTHHGVSALNVSTQRGCPYTCKWCSTAVYGQSYRRRPVQDVVSEMKYLQETYEVDTLWMVDDVFTVSHKWLKEFVEELRAREISVPFECITRADRLTAEVVGLLKEAGCFRVWIGAESGSQKIIDKMDRRVDVTHVREMIIEAKKQGIETGTFIMVGYPEEDLNDLRETFKHLKESLPDLLTITTAYPIRGTDLHDEMEGEIAALDWRNSTDRDIKLPTTYKPKFYPHAKRWIMQGVSAERAKRDGKFAQWVVASSKSKVSKLLMRMYQ